MKENQKYPTKSLLTLKHLQVENANTIAGMTYGFPAVPHFLGFVHALQRKLNRTYPELKFGGCAIVSHKQQIHCHSSPKKTQSFALARHPLTKQGETPPIIEEGRMNLTISLVIQCYFNQDELAAWSDEGLEQKVEQLTLMQHLAGGFIHRIDKVEFESVTEEKAVFQCLRRLTPGFLLLSRHEYLQDYRQQKPELEPIDAWLDFIALKSKTPEEQTASKNSTQNEETSPSSKTEDKFIPKPMPGWLVPIMSGYRAISDIQPPGAVDKTRDPNTPFCFVEAVYTIGQWLNPYRLKDWRSAFWNYHVDLANGWYLCQPETKCPNTAQNSHSTPVFEPASAEAETIL